MLVNGNDFYCGNSSSSPCQLALKNQIPSAYVHPSTKQCNYSVDLSGYAKSSELNSLKTSVSSGKSLVASAVTGKGVSTAADASFQTIADNINAIQSGFTGGWSAGSGYFNISTGDNDVSSYNKYALVMAYEKGSRGQQIFLAVVDRINRNGFVGYSFLDYNAYPYTQSGYFGLLNLYGGQYPSFNGTVTISNGGDLVNLSYSAASICGLVLQ